MRRGTDDLVSRFQHPQRSSIKSAKEARRQWRLLKSLVFQFAFEGRRLGVEKFTWSRTTGQPQLILSNVAVTLSDRGELNGTPQDCKLLFSCNDGKFGANSPPPNQAWTLVPEIRDGQFAWTVRETGRAFTPGELADEIATELIRYHVTYEGFARQETRA